VAEIEFASNQLVRSTSVVGDSGNADIIAAELSPLQPERAARFVLQRVDEEVAKGESFAFETTLANRSYACRGLTGRCQVTLAGQSRRVQAACRRDDWLAACSSRRMATMRAAVFEKQGKISVREVPKPEPGPGQALIRVTLTTICGTDVHILRGEYPVKSGLIVGHEPVGVIESVGAGVTGYAPGDRVIVGAITPCGQCRACLSGSHSQCDHGGGGYEALGGWRFGNTIDGCQAEYVRVPDAMANLAPVPDGLTDEQVLMCPDIMSTGFSAAERGAVKIGDAVVVLAQGPIGLCATAGAKLSGASLVIGVDRVPARLEVARSMGADVVINSAEQDVVEEVRRLTGGGADVTIEALGQQATFEAALRCVRPGGTVSSLGVYSGHLQLPLDAFAAGLGDHHIVTSLCPGGKERMRRLMSVVASGRFSARRLVTHTFSLDQIEEAYDLFSHQRAGVLKVAIRP
jgi:threonine dehydrogenase-like Zn-dependent dehydrogenase